MEEVLPVLEMRKGKLIVVGKRERQDAHGKQPSWHGTAIIIAALPEGKILLADKSQKQRRKGRSFPEGSHIYDCFGGHMRYEDIPEAERRDGVSMDTFRESALREFSEELFLLDEEGNHVSLNPVLEHFIPVGLYEMENDHNREYSWVFLYRLAQYGNYASEDTLETEEGEIVLSQPVKYVTWKELLELYQGADKDKAQLSDAIGRVLRQDKGKVLYQLLYGEKG